MSDGLHVEVANVDAIIASLASLGEQIVEIAARAAVHEAEFELPLTRAQVPIGPTGQLRLSGRIEGPDFEQETLTAGIAYGGPPGAGLNDVDVDYAVIVHEDLEAHHPIGNAKFVENVVREELTSGRAAARMGAEIIASLKPIVLSGRFTSRSGSYLQSPTTGRFLGSTS